MAFRLPIKDGTMHFGADLATVAAILHAGTAKRDGVTVPPLTEVAAVPPVPARVYRNQWIVDCPDCGGTQFVWLTQPLLLCMSCWNARVAGKWRPVALPPHREAIERILAARPLPQQRNWTEETLSELMIENLLHGDPEMAAAA